MGMLLHHTWLEQQKRNAKPQEVETAKVKEAEVESAKEPVKKTGGRRKGTSSK